MDLLPCPGCSTDISVQQKYCQHCGVSVADHLIQCKMCESMMHPDAKFCVNCGESVVKKTSLFKKLIRLLFVIILVVLILLILMRSSVYSPTLSNRIKNAVNQDSAFSESSSSIQLLDNPIVYEQQSFHTLIFAGNTTHEAEIFVPSPTNQLFITKTIDVFLQDKSEIIAGKDILVVYVYEKKLAENSEQVAQFVKVDLDTHQDYKFPSGKFQPLDNNLYVQWFVKK